LADSEDAILLQRRARRRLVGAIALVVFTVIVLPIVFDKEKPPERQDLVLQIPSQDAPRFSAKVQPAPPSAPAEKAPPVELPPAVEQKEAAPPKPAPEQTKQAAPRFVVALGAYSERNMKQLSTKISSAGYRSFTEKVPNKADQLRLRAGPFPTRAAAEEARDRLKSHGFSDAVVRQEP
jgi:DedD protein